MDRQRPDLSMLTLPRSARRGGFVHGVLGLVRKGALFAGVSGAVVLGLAEADRRDLFPAWTKAALEGAGPAAGGGVAPPPKPVVRPSRPRGPAPLMAPVLGYVVAPRKAALGFARAGRIIELDAEVGRTIEKGHLVARLDDGLIRAEAARAKVQLDEAKRELARRESLAKEGVGTDVERDAMRSRVDLLAAELRLVEENLLQCELRAPFAGVVTAKHAEVGETVGGFVAPGAAGAAPGGAIVTITDLSAPEVEADVPEARAEDLAPDQPAVIELDALGGVKFKARLRLVLPVADRRKGTVPVRVVLVDKPPRLRPDTSARVTFLKTGPAANEPEPMVEPVVVAPPPKPPEGAAPAARDAFAWARGQAKALEKLPHAREYVYAAFGLFAAAWVLGHAWQLVRSRRAATPRPLPGSPSPAERGRAGEGAPAAPPPAAAGPAPPNAPPEASPKKAAATRTRHSRASFRVLKQDSISDIESVEEMYVLEEDEDTDDDAEAPAVVDRRVHALGPSGRITGEPWLLRPHKGRERPVLDLEAASVPFEVDGATGARVFPAKGATVKIEDVKVPCEGASLVHGMVFHVDETPYVYLDRAANDAERRRVFVVPVDERTSISGKLIVESGDDARGEASPRAPRSRRERAHESQDGEDAPARAAFPPLERRDPIVQIRGLEKVYRRGSHEVPVLAGVDLDILPGDFVAFMGPSGSGKTTLLNVIGGVDRPTAGRVVVAQEEISRYSESALAKYRARCVGFVFQFYNLLPVLTAFENVEFPLLRMGLSRSERKERVYNALSLVGMADRASHRPRELSGGQEQRVAIARALVTDPPLIVGDEPTGDLDSENAELVLDLLVRLNVELGKTILMVTHDPHAAERARTTRRLEKGVLA